jgi:hypothetical protein
MGHSQPQSGVNAAVRDPRYRSHQTPDRRALASAPVRRSQGYPWAETTAGMICISPRHYPMMTGWLQAKQQEGRPSRNGPNIHNRYLMAADICGETGAGREGSPAARETPAMDGRANKRATIIRYHIMILSYYRRHCACSQESRAPVSSLAGGPGARRSAQAHHANRRTGERRNAFHNALWELARHGASPARRG